MAMTLGWIGTALVIISYAQTTSARLRIVSLISSVVLIAFNIMIGIWSNVALEIALIALNGFRLLRNGNGDGTIAIPDESRELVLTST